MENPINILVVEDDTNINNLLKTALEKAGYQVIQAFSGTEAELVLQMQKSVSLVLLASGDFRGRSFKKYPGEG